MLCINAIIIFFITFIKYLKRIVLVENVDRIDNIWTRVNSKRCQLLNAILMLFWQTKQTRVSILIISIIKKYTICYTTTTKRILTLDKLTRRQKT